LPPPTRSAPAIPPFRNFIEELSKIPEVCFGVTLTQKLFTEWTNLVMTTKQYTPGEKYHVEATYDLQEISWNFLGNELQLKRMEPFFHVLKWRTQLVKIFLDWK